MTRFVGLTVRASVWLAMVAVPAASLAQDTHFRRGDANQSGATDLSDGVFVLVSLFSGGDPLPCLDAADTDDSGELELTDAVFLFTFLFLGGAAPPAPFTECGLDPSPDALGCDRSVCPDPEPTLPGVYGRFLDGVEIELEESVVVVRATGVPNHPSPYFQRDDPRWEAPHAGLRLNPNRIAAQDFVFRIPRSPRIAARPGDTRLGPIGVSVSGVALFNQYAAMFAPLDREILSFDRHNGHPTGGSVYHYHLEPVFLTSEDPSAVVGVMLDGFPLYGPRESDGSAPAELDDCNGHTHPTREHPEGIYHYHVVPSPPYFVGCFRGTPGQFSN